MAGTRIEAWVRGRFVEVPGARAERLRANAWTVHLPRTEAVSRALRLKGGVRLDALDDLVLALDAEEAAQVVPSRETADAVEVTVLL
jgi:hypothetical protein